MESQNYIYNNNLYAFKKKNISLEVKEQSEKQIDINIFESKEGLPTLEYKVNGNTYYIHSKYKPLEEARRSTKSIDKLTVNVVVFGLGLGYHIEEILKKTGEDARIVIIEPDYNLLDKILKKIDLTNIILDERVYICVLTDKLELKKIMSTFINWDKSCSVEFLYMPNYKKIFLEELELVARTLKEVMVGQKLNKNTIASFAEEWQENFFKNLPYIFESTPMTYFKGMFKNIPAIIVSAGPSLNKNIEQLKAIRNKALIFATDSALKVLFKYDIKPHLVFTIDGKAITYEKFRDINYSDIPLVYDILAYKNVIKDHKGKKIFYSSLYDYIYEIYKDKGIDTIMQLGGSVATAAFKMACYIDADPIIFIGQDLSFTKERTHAEGTMHDEELYQKMWNNGLKERTEASYYEIKGNYEEKVLTDYSYHHFLLWFEDAIQMEKGKRKFINATEGGAFIKGTEVLTLKETIDLYCINEYNLEDQINELIENGNPIKREELNKIVSEQKEILENLKIMKKKAFLAIRSIDKAKKQYEKNKVYSGIIVKTVKKLDEIDRYLEKQQNSVKFINYILGKSIIEAKNSLYGLEKLDETEQEKGLRVMLGNELFYKGIHSGIEKVEVLFNEYLDIMDRKLGGN